MRNLRTIKRRILRSGATPAFVYSTPVTFDKEKDDLLKKYNRAAKR